MRKWLLGLALALGLAAPAVASQNVACIPTTGTVSGLTLVTDINAAFDTILSMASGASAPAITCGGTPSAGALWLDTSTTPNIWKVYDGSTWLTAGYVDGTAHVWTPPVGGGADTVASAATADLCSKPQAYLNISGTTTINSFGSTCPTGVAKFLRFTGALTLSYNATSMILPTAANITTVAGDAAVVVSLGGGNWVAIAYTRADGTSLASASAFSSQIIFSGIITPSSLSSNTNDWAPTGLATANTIRASGTIDLNITGLTAQPAGTIELVQNVGSTVLTLVNGSASSSSANRFSLGADLALAPSAGVLIRYDGVLSNWVVIAGYPTIASQTDATTGTNNSKMMTPLRVAQALATGGSAADYQAFTASGTWTKPSGTTSSSRTFVACWGGGGGGGSSSGGGGGGGGYGQNWFSTSSLGSTESVTVAGAASTNTAGDNSTFGSWLTAYGGGGGNGSGGGGGGGGGLTSKGSSSSGSAGGTGGLPQLGAGGGTGAGSNGSGRAGGGGAGNGSANAGGYGSPFGGAGGGGGTGTHGAGGAALFGGGGGGGQGGGGVGGPSIYGGAGGDEGVAGSAPAGGGGAGAAGGRGECRVTTFK